MGHIQSTWLVLKLTLWLPAPPLFTDHGLSDVGLMGKCGALQTLESLLVLTP